MKRPRRRPSTPKKLPPEEEALLYGLPSQPLVQYPPVVLPNESELANGPIAAQLGVVPKVESDAKPSAVESIVRRLTLGGIRRAGTRMRVQVGLDFGTSTTKVMYRVLGVADRTARVVSFGHGLETYPDYCLPSLASFDRRGNLLLADAAVRQVGALGWGSGLSRMKMLIAGRAEERYLDRQWDARFREHVKLALGDDLRCSPEALAVVHLAAVMRRVRQSIEKELRTEDLDLIFNTCVPVDQSERTPVVIAFERVIAAAINLEREDALKNPARFWLERAAVLHETASYDAGNDETRVFLMPEAVATAAGYVSSVRRKAGLHALVDIGAGTTDVSICMLSLALRSGATTFWYAARSIPMGAGRIEAMVATALARAGNDTITTDRVHRAIAGDAAFRRYCGNLVQEELTRMWYGTARAWNEAYGHHSTTSAWASDQVTVFLTGGGALIPDAKGVFARSGIQNCGPYPCSIIPTPETFDTARSKAPFIRLSVAFGLATPLPELGYHVLPSKTPDHTPRVPKPLNWQQDGDQLLPRWGWT
jgi:hypothetical protein